MAREQFGNQTVSVPNEKFRDPSYHRGPVDGPDESQFASEFPDDQVTHKLARPKGESSQAELRPWRSGDRVKRGKPVDRFQKSQLAYAPPSHGSGVGDGLSGGDEHSTRKKSWNKDGKATDGAFEPGNGARKGLSAIGG